MSDANRLITEEVHLSDGRSYPVLIGPGAANELAGIIPPKARKAAIVTQANIGLTVDPGIEHRVFTVPDGESAKTIAVFESLMRQFAEWGLNRNDVVVAVGGGVVTDLGGFAAASYHRGIPVVHVSTTLLGQIDAALKSFFKDLKQQGNDERVTLMTFSEFGRRVGENASAGTDHGKGSCLFVAGAPVKGGLYGKHPSLTELDKGDLKHTVDFRRVYATVLEDWLQGKAGPILGGDYKSLGFIG